MRKTLIALFIFVTVSAFAQKKKNDPYVYIGDSILGQDAPAGQQPRPTAFWGSSMDYAVYAFSNVMWANLNNKREMQRLQYEREQSMVKLGMIKAQYAGYDTFPAKIIDGWHNVVATDNSNFCKDAKVLIKNNRVIRFVIENCIPINFLATGEIKKAKNIITLKNFNGEQLNLLELYFLYDIEQQIVAPAPGLPGYVCFWTDHGKPENIVLKMDDKLMEKFTVHFDKQPECFEKGTICRILKPGTYSYFADKRGGAGSWRGTFEVKPGYCIRIGF